MLPRAYPGLSLAGGTCHHRKTEILYKAVSPVFVAAPSRILSHNPAGRPPILSPDIFAGSAMISKRTQGSDKPLDPIKTSSLAFVVLDYQTTQRLLKSDEDVLKL